MRTIATKNDTKVARQSPIVSVTLALTTDWAESPAPTSSPRIMNMFCNRNPPGYLDRPPLRVVRFYDTRCADGVCLLDPLVTLGKLLRLDHFMRHAGE